jgi:hypothetical protein
MVRGVEELACLFTLSGFKNINPDFLTILVKRSNNGFPTLFVNCTMPNGEFREQLEGHNIYFLTTNNEPLWKQIRPFLDKWLEDKKKLTE